MKYYKLTIFLFLLVFSAQIAEADVQPIVSAESGGFIQSIENIYKFAQGLGVALAIIMIAAGGIYIAISGANPSKQQEGKDMIKSAIFGLVLLFGAVLILNTINPKLTILSLNRDATEINLPESEQQSVTSCPREILQKCSPSVQVYDGRAIDPNTVLPRCTGVLSSLVNTQGVNCSQNIYTQPQRGDRMQAGDRYLRLPYYPRNGGPGKAQCIFVAWEHDGEVKNFDFRANLLRCPPPSPFDEGFEDAAAEPIAVDLPAIDASLQSCAGGFCSHETAVAYLQRNGVRVSSSGAGIYAQGQGCSVQADEGTPCGTSLEQIPATAIQKIVDLKRGCDCQVTVTGGTDFGRVEHQPGQGVIDIDASPLIAEYLLDYRNDWGANVQYIRIPHVMLRNIRGLENLPRSELDLYTEVFNAYGRRYDDSGCSVRALARCTPSHFHIVFS